jgi:hypothetical protein
MAESGALFRRPVGSVRGYWDDADKSRASAVDIEETTSPGEADMIECSPKALAIGVTLLTTAGFALTGGTGVAQTPAFGAPAGVQSPGGVSSAIITSRGPALVTGNASGSGSVTIPGSGAPGMLMNNGNGSSTLSIPGRAPETVFSPR